MTFRFCVIGSEFIANPDGCKASPSKAGLPDMGRALTDVQELRQVDWLHYMFYVD